MKLKNFTEIERATKHGRREISRFGIGLIFIVSIMVYAAVSNIGANDVANNVGPAVGSRPITMTGAIVIAVFFEVMGALIAGGDVVSTVRGGIIDPAAIPDSNHFIWMMIAALLAGALWLNFATAIGAPVSTTHSIVGAVLGAGVAAGGMAAGIYYIIFGIFYA